MPKKRRKAIRRKTKGTHHEHAHFLTIAALAGLAIIAVTIFSTGGALRADLSSAPDLVMRLGQHPKGRVAAGDRVELTIDIVNQKPPANAAATRLIVTLGNVNLTYIEASAGGCKPQTNGEVVCRFPTSVLEPGQTHVFTVTYETTSSCTAQGALFGATVNARERENNTRNNRAMIEIAC